MTVIMRLRPVSQHLVFMSVLLLTRAQTTPTPSAMPALGIFYPFGSAEGDTEYSLSNFGDESHLSVGLSTPYTFFGRTYNQLYIHFNGLLTFNQPEPTSGPNYNPTRGAEDFIAPLWSDIDDYYSGVFSYQQYTNGSVLTRATQDINQYFPQTRFSASSVFVVTWEFGDRISPSIKFQVVLVSGGGSSFFLMNYGDCAVLSEQVQAGYDTINSTHSFVIPDSINGNYQNLKNTSNINVKGRWAFLVNEALGIFYPFGSAEGDTEYSLSNFGDESHLSVGLSTPYTFFGRTYNQLYIHFNGLLTFNQPEPTSGPNYNPTRGAEDFIAPLWSDIDDYYSGVFSYQQYTNGSVLTRATQDINQYFPQTRFSASSVFVVTWEFGDRISPSIKFQVVLVSGGGSSFFLMNYGDCAVLSEQVQAGYDTIGSTHSFVIPDSINGNYQNLNNTSNVNVKGRWAFLVNEGNVIGVQLKAISFSDLTQNGNIEFLMQKINQVLVNHGVSSPFELKLRKVQKIQP